MTATGAETNRSVRALGGGFFQAGLVRIDSKARSATFPAIVNMRDATIEYAVGVLGVADVIVCGHTDCGVMKGVMNPEPLEPLTSVSAWLNYAQPARKAVELNEETRTGDEFLLAVTERNVIEQLGNLRTHPCIADRIEHGDLSLHGWVYDLGEGIVTAYDPDRTGFAPLETLIG